MRTKSFALLAALCCTVLSGVADVSQSVEVGESAELARGGRRDNNRDINLGLATTGQMVVDGNTAVFTVSEPGQRRDLTGDGKIIGDVIHVFDATSGEVRNLGLDSVGFTPLLQGRMLAFCAFESPVDLNGDGDMDDGVLHVYDTVRRSLTNLRLAGCGDVTDGRRLVFSVDEASQGQDLNQDGDAQDRVVHIFDLVTGRIQNTRLTLGVVGLFGLPQDAVEFLDDRRIAVVAERPGSFTLGLHLVDTATGRVSDLGLRISNFDPGGFEAGFKVGGGQALVPVPSDVDLNGDGNFANDKVLHRIDLASGRVENTGIAIADSLYAGAFGPADPALFIAQEGLAVFNIAEADQGKDLNGDGDISDVVLHKMSTRTGRLQSLKVSGRVLLSESAPGLGVVFMSEEENGKDLNGDGDIGAVECCQPEFVLGLLDLRGSEPRVVNTRLAISLIATNGDDLGEFFTDTNAFQMRGDLVSFIVPELLQGKRDLNGDGDTADAVLHIADLSTFTTRNTGLSGAFAFRPVQAPMLPASDGRVVVPVRESRQGRDLNRDGDIEDMVLQTFDVRSGRARNTGLAIATAPIPTLFVPFGLPLMIRGETFVSVLVPEGSVDLNADGDRADNVLHILDVATGKLTNVGLAAGTNASSDDFADPSFRFAGLCSGFSFPARFFGGFFGPACAGPGIGDAYTFLVSEAAQGNIDLNGDGDTDDFVVHATRLTDRDRNGRLDFAETATSVQP